MIFIDKLTNNPNLKRKILGAWGGGSEIQAKRQNQVNFFDKLTKYPNLKKSDFLTKIFFEGHRY